MDILWDPDIFLLVVCILIGTDLFFICPSIPDRRVMTDDLKFTSRFNKRPKMIRMGVDILVLFMNFTLLVHFNGYKLGQYIPIPNWLYIDPLSQGNLALFNFAVAFLILIDRIRQQGNGSFLRRIISFRCIAFSLVLIYSFLQFF